MHSCHRRFLKVPRLYKTPLHRNPLFVSGSANYSFSDSLRLDKQFDTSFKKIKATLYFEG